ncbi:OmpA family protein [Hydrotalea sp.]|uniref:OmpA family protein n=1 Tax=Hydrotalea sp. TaxID=2881279 RepID=UPI003D12662A
MKLIMLSLGILFCINNTHSQLLKKLQQKAEQAVSKKIDKADAPKTNDNPKKSDAGDNATASSQSRQPDLKVYSKFDFVPGTTILYFDNFEKDNIGEAPEGWITSKSAEVVTIDGLEGKWVKMAASNATHISRNKKQSWGNNFTIEFDLLIVKNSYDPRLDIVLYNTGGNLVTDEGILQSAKPAIYFESIIAGENKSRAILRNLDKRLSDNMSEELPYNNLTPVHVSMCVQGKRFRMWWNDRKLYDLPAVNETYLPNQFGFNFGSVGGTDYYVSNIRVAKDVPDTRSRFEEGKLVSNLLFYSGTANLKPESMGALLDVSKVLKETTTLVKIVGHTDSDGDEALNLKLSQQRAETVKNILVNQYNIDASKLTTEGRGESQPIADNKTPEGKAQNRRVEFIFKPEADNYSNTINSTSESKPNAAKPSTNTSTGKNSTPVSNTNLQLQSKILNTQLPFAQFMKTGENTYTFIASKEEGNSKENYVKIHLVSVNSNLKPETFNFQEINQKQPLYGTKQYAEIKDNEAVLFYGTDKKPYVYKFSPIVTNGHMANFVDEGLIRHLPAASPTCKFVIEKVENGKASGYFTFGVMIQGLKPIKKGDAMTETFTNGFAGDIKGTFTNVPIY